MSLAPESGGGKKTQVTSVAGAYQFTGVAPGQYRVMAEFAGFLAPEPILVTVRSGAFRMKELVLVPDSEMLNGVVGREGDPPVDVVRKTPVPR